MERWPTTSLLALLYLLVTEGSGAAQAQIQARLRVSGGASTGTPLPGVIGGSGAHDVWGELRPELSLTFGPPRALVSVDYAFTGALHWQLPGANAISNRLVLGARFEPSRNTTLLLAGDATQSSIYGALLQGNPSDGSVLVLPSGNLETVGAALRESLTWEASPRWRLGQSLGATLLQYLEQPLSSANLSAYVGGALDHLWRADSLGAEVTGTLVHYGTVATVGAGPTRPAQAAQANNQLLLLALPRWRHDLNAWLSGSIALGAAGAVGLSGGRESFVGVAGRASLLVHGRPGSLSIELSRLLQPGQLTGQTWFMNAAALRGSLTLSEVHQVVLSGSVGYSSASLDLSGNAQGPALDAVLADLGLAWAPAPLVQLSARYQFSDQIAGSTTTLPSTLRHTALLAVTVLYPGAGATPVMVRLPERVDGADARAAPARTTN